jgi:S1-C subfamily serine protease
VILVLTLFSWLPQRSAPQGLGTLHIKVTLVDADQKSTPVPRHALLISDNPASAPPRRVFTALDGTADVQLRAGNYTVESDQPVSFQGKAYQWTQMIDIRAGQTATLELTDANAEVGAPTATTTSLTGPVESDPSLVLLPFHDSVFAVWTPIAHASGFLIDGTGLVATNQRAVGTSTSVEVQLTAAIKVAGRVLATNAERDVALVRVDPKTVESVKPVPLGCGQPAKKPVTEGQEIFTISAPLRQNKGMTSGVVLSAGAHAMESDFRIAVGGAGGPVFTADGTLVGLTSVVDEHDATARGDLNIIRADDVCEVMASAAKTTKDVASPDGTHLPIEPTRPFPVDALKDAVQHRAGSLNPYQMSSNDFDVAFITPIQIYNAQYQAEQESRRDRAARGKRPPTQEPEPVTSRPLLEFANWSEYVADIPPVLMIRVTPKFEEGFWTKVARGAAQTQGMAIPPIKRFKSGFSRLRAFCGETEITPIHPFRLEQHVSETDTIYEGLYIFDPGAFGPQCASVKLTLYSEKEPDKADTRPVDPKLVQQLWQDFAPWRGSQ